MMVFERFFSKKFFLLALFSLYFSSCSVAFASGEAEDGPYNPKEATFHHLLDNYYWEFGPWGKLGLPRILWNKKSGSLDFFANTEAAVAAGYVEAHNYNHDAAHGALLVPEVKDELNVPVKEHNSAAHAEAEDLSEYTPLDFSITKNVLYMFIAAALTLIIFISVANSYKRRQGAAPKGLQSFMEPVVVFIRDEIAKENIGEKKYERFMPLLLTFFFFILFLNLLGLTPFSGNVTGNISVTLALSLITLASTIIFASKDFWKHIFWPPVPHGVKIIMVPLEVLSIFTKPFSLTIRLFANITAGHVMIISLIGLIFIFGKNGQNPGLAWGVGIFSSLFVVAISLLELFVALLQAYVFTMLTAVFIGQSVESHDDHHD
ncbi:MAG: F0F1 ATP synthase subunit A, partial [Bacteroidota bacterium]|nr:F0F1 ATP synthase subunit A [Bacteroidota bacterium]